MSVFAKANLTSSDGTTAQFGVGDTYYASEGTVYVYCKATAATIKAYAACSGANPGVVEEATTTTATALGTSGGFACVPQFAVGASEYFWAVVECPTGADWQGNAIKVFSENQTAGTLCYSTATDGNLDDSSAGSAIPLIGVTTLATTTTAAATQFTTFRRMGWAK